MPEPRLSSRPLLSEPALAALGNSPRRFSWVRPAEGGAVRLVLDLIGAPPGAAVSGPSDLLRERAGVAA